MIEIEGLKFGYRRQELYEHFDLNLSEPGLYGLFGRNGSGKSTLLKLMAGLLFRHAGHIRVGGLDPQQRDPSLLAGIYLDQCSARRRQGGRKRPVRRGCGGERRQQRTVVDQTIPRAAIDTGAPSPITK